MAQIFSPTADTWFRAILVAILLGAVATLLIAGGAARSEYVTRVARTPAQPVPFSHKHHAGELGIDCRYCHTSVETSADAGFPATHVCMTCHSQLWTNAAMLAPVRESMANGTPLVWNRVNRLPGYVYFDHHVHVRNGVPCIACHGDVRKMPLLRKAAPLTMRWCLDCHRDPAPHLRPQASVFEADWSPPADRRALGERLMRLYRIKPPGRLTHCSVCHR